MAETGGELPFAATAWIKTHGGESGHSRMPHNAHAAQGNNLALFRSHKAFTKEAGLTRIKT
jgi:hypothetical protein